MPALDAVSGVCPANVEEGRRVLDRRPHYHKFFSTFNGLDSKNYRQPDWQYCHYAP